MKWWILLMLCQLLLNFVPITQWKYIYKRTRCWMLGCQCINYYTPKASTPHLKRLVEDEMMKMEFINTSWNLYEKLSLTKRQRIAKDVDKYFNGYKGP